MMDAQSPQGTTQQIANQNVNPKYAEVRIIDDVGVSVGTGFNSDGWIKGPIVKAGGTSSAMGLRLDHYLNGNDISPNAWWGEHDLSVSQLMDMCVSPNVKVEWDQGSGDILARLGLRTKNFEYGPLSGSMCLYPWSSNPQMDGGTDTGNPENQVHVNLGVDLGKGYMFNGMFRHHSSRTTEGNFKNVWGAGVKKKFKNGMSAEVCGRKYPDKRKNVYVNLSIPVSKYIGNR